MAKKSRKMTDDQLKAGIKSLKEQNEGKLSIVKWVWDNSDKGLKDSKEFVDTHI